MIGHSFKSPSTASGDTSKLQPVYWGKTGQDLQANPTHEFTGGAHGSLVARDTGDTVDGLAYVAAGAGFLAATGVGQMPAFRALAAADLPSGLSNFLVSGPTQARTYTLPDANATIVTTNTVPSLNGIALPATTSSVLGVITQNGFPFLHAYKPPLGTAAEQNLFIGRNAGNFTMTTVGGSDPATDGQFNLGIGDGVLAGLTRGAWNICIGNAAGRSITTGLNNVVVGGDSLLNITTGTDNAAFGVDAMRDIVGAASTNTALGARAMKLNTTGSNNTVVGYDAFAEGPGTGSDNVAVGALAMNLATSANMNVAVGANALLSLTTGDTNTAIGAGAGDSILGGGANTLMGAGAGNTITSGSNNTLIGILSGDNITTGNRNLIIGDQLDAASATGEDQMNIGGVLVGFTALGTTPGLVGTFLAGAANAPSVKIGDAGLYQEATGKISFSTASARQMSLEAGFLTIWNQAANLRFGTSPDTVIRRSGTNTLTIDNGAAGAGNLAVTTSVASAVFKTTTALITAVDGSGTAAFTANMVASTGGPTTTAQNGWLKAQDSAGATVWIPVWK